MRSTIAPARPAPASALALAIAVAVAGCGGGGGGGGSSAAGDGTVRLGSRAMPDGVIAVAAEGGIRRGADTVFLVDVPTDYPAIANVAAGWTVDGAATDLATVTTARSSGRYAVAVPLPSTLPAGARLFVRLTHADGAVVESGRSDFVLAGR